MNAVYSKAGGVFQALSEFVTSWLSGCFHVFMKDEKTRKDVYCMRFFCVEDEALVFTSADYEMIYAVVLLTICTSCCG